MVDKTKQGSNKGNPVAKHMRTFNKATVQRDRKKDDKRGYSKHSNRYESADEFVPHDMFHPETGETKRADSKATHLVLKARGWTHSKNESVEQVDEGTRGGGVHGLNTWGPTRSSVMRIRKQNDADRSQARKEKEPELLDDAKDTINHYLKKSGGLPKTLSRYDSNFYQSAIQQIERISGKTAAKKEVAKGIKKHKGVKESVEQVDEADRGSSSKHPPVKVGDKFTHANRTRVVTKVTPDGINATRTNGTERTAHDHGYVQKQMVESVDNAKSEKDSARMKLRHANQKVRLAKKQERENDRVSEDAGDPNSSAKKPVKFKKPDGTTGVKMVPAHQDVQTEACWDSHKQVGTKKKGGKTVPNCVPKESSKLDELSNDKVHNYLSKSMHQSDDAKSRGDSKLRAKREKGIKLGLKKQTGTAKVASTESYQQVLEASSNYLSKDDLPAKVKRVVINIFKLAKSKKKKIVRLSVELVGKKYYVYVELGRDNNDEDFVGRMMDMETGREKFLEIHPSASVHPAPNVSIREAVQQVDEAKKVASVKSIDRNGNTHFLHHHDNGVVSANNDKKSGIGLGNLAPFHRGGTADRKKAVHTIAKSAKNSKDLASKLNKSGLGRSNWEVNEEIEEAYFSVQFRDEKGKADSSSKNFKSASAAKKYADNANKTTKVGSYTTNKVQGRMESVEQVDEGVSKAKIDTLRKQFSTLGKIKPDSLAHRKMTKDLEGRSVKELEGIAKAKIRFLSQTAAIVLQDKHGVKLKFGDGLTAHARYWMESVEQVDEGVLNDIRDFIVAVGAAIPTKKNKKNAKDKALEDQIRMAMEADPEFDKIVRSVVFVRKDGVAAFKQGGRDKLDKYVFKTVDAKVAAKLGTLQKGYIRTMASGEKRNLGQNPRFNKGEKKAKEQGKIVYGDDMSSTQRQTTHAIGKIIKQVAKRAYDDAKKEQKNESFRQVEEGRKLVLNINPKWSMKEVNREIKDTTQEIKQGQADHKRRPMNPTQADQHWQRKHYLEKLVALRKKKKSLGEDTMTDSISGNWGKVNEAISDVVVKKMQDMVGGPKNMPRGPEFRALKAKAQAAVAAEKKAKKSAPKAKTTTKTAKGKTHKGSADASDRNIIMQLRIAQDSMNHGDKTGDVLVSPTRTVALSKGKIDALLKKHDAIQKPVDKRKFVVLMTKALRGMK